MSELERELADLERTAPDLGPLVPPVPPGGGFGGRPGDGGSGGGARSRGATVALLAALALLIVGLLGPVASLLMALAGWVYGTAAELLEVTGGLDRGLFDSARLWAAVVNAAVIGWCVVRRVRRGGSAGRGAAWRPLVGLWLCYLGALWVLVPVDVYSEYDVSDPLTTFLLVGAAMLIGPGLLLIAVELGLRALRAGWRSAGRSADGLRRVVVGAGLVGVTLLSLTGVALLGAERGYFGEVSQPVGVEDDVDAMVTLDREWFVSASAGLAPNHTGPLSYQGEQRMSDCYDTLTQEKSADGSPLDHAVTRAKRRGLYEADARDVAWDTLTRVCVRYAEHEIEDLWAYYGRAIENALKDKGKRLFRESEIADALRWFVDPGRPSRGRDRRVREALGALSQLEREVIVLKLVRGYSHAEVGRRVGKSEGAAAQLFCRARRKFVERCDALDCRGVN